MRYSNKCFQICTPQGQENYWFYKGEVYIVRSAVNAKSIKGIIGLICSLGVLISVFMRVYAEKMNDLGQSYLAAHREIEIVLTLIGVVFYVVIKRIVCHYNVNHIIKHEKTTLLPDLDWKNELKATIKLFIQYVSFFYILPTIVCLGMGFCLNWLSNFIGYDFILCLVGVLSANTAFIQRIKFQKKMIAETNNHLEPMVRS